MPTLPPTAEQLHIHELFGTGKPLLIRAGAGTGKTTTLLQLAEILEHEDRLGLYIAFNRAIAEEAQRKFPANVRAMTAHSLAYRNLMQNGHGPLLAKLRAPRVQFRVTETRLGITGISIAGPDGGYRYLTPYKITRHVIRTVEEFCKTADEELGPQHVPTMIGLDAAGEDGNHQNLIDHVLPLALKAWADLRNPAGGAMRFSHGHYLKLWQLTHPRIGRSGAALFLDEAQDTSPVLASVVAEQDHLHRVYVGDGSQAIYRFTGAMNAMDRFGDAVEGRLTQSWRFGPAVADAANYMLGRIGDDMRLTGNPGRDSRVVRGLQNPCDAVLTRTNGTALAEVMAAQRAGRTVHLMGGDAEYAIRFCEGAARLQAGQPASHEDLSAFTTWAEVQEYTEDAPDANDLKVLVKLIDDHGAGTVRNALSRIQPEDRASLIVATAHRSKGREFDRVRLAGDLAEAIDRAEDGADPASLRDERMLAYVAITRAKLTLDPGDLVPTPTSPIMSLSAPPNTQDTRTPAPPQPSLPLPAPHVVEIRFDTAELESLQRKAGDDVAGWLRSLALEHAANRAS